MGTSADEVSRIQQQIATTRNDMGRTLQAIENKIGPSAIKERAREATLGRMETMVDKVKANPLPLAMAAVGIGWFIAGLRSGSSTKMITNAKLDQVTDKLDQVKERVSQKTSEVESVVERTYLDNPLAVGLGVVAAGVAIGLAIPITQKEQRWLGTARDRLIQKAEQAADQALDKVEQQNGGQQNGEPQNAERPVSNAVDPTGF